MKTGLVLIASGSAMLLGLGADAEAAEAKDVTVRKGHVYQVPHGFELRAIYAGGRRLARTCAATGLVCRYWRPPSYVPTAVTTFPRRYHYQPRVKAVKRAVRARVTRWGPLY